MSRLVTTIMSEAGRFRPEGMEDAGLLNIDLSVYPRNLTCSFVLYKEECTKEMFCETLCGGDPGYYKDIVLNHRYPNKNYNTLSKKEGRKVCKTGYPVFGDVEDLNQYKYLVVKVTVPDDEKWKDEDDEQIYVYLIFKLDLKLTKADPVHCLEIMVVGREEGVAIRLDSFNSIEHSVYAAGQVPECWMGCTILEGDPDLGGNFLFAPDHAILFSPPIGIVHNERAAAVS